MQPYRTIDEYIKNFSSDVQKTLQKIRQTIKKEMPGAEEAIRYGIPTIRLQGQNLVHFAAFKNHISFFPGAEGVAVFQKEITKYKTSKGTIQFPLDSVPYDLIQKITQFRVKQQQK